MLANAICALKIDYLLLTLRNLLYKGNYIYALNYHDTPESESSALEQQLIFYKKQRGLDIYHHPRERGRVISYLHNLHEVVSVASVTDRKNIIYLFIFFILISEFFDNNVRTIKKALELISPGIL